jgi:hypothetical protein
MTEPTFPFAKKEYKSTFSNGSEEMPKISDEVYSNILFINCSFMDNRINSNDLETDYQAHDIHFS